MLHNDKATTVAIGFEIKWIYHDMLLYISDIINVVIIVLVNGLVVDWAIIRNTRPEELTKL